MSDCQGYPRPIPNNRKVSLEERHRTATDIHPLIRRQGKPKLSLDMRPLTEGKPWV